MPLSAPAPRKNVFTRKITCNGYAREDGLWDIEGHLRDTRGHDYSTEWRGEVKQGEAGHEMWLRWTIGEDIVIRAIEVVTDSAPYPLICPNAASGYQRLVGVRIGKGFIQEVQDRIARTEGCTHLFTLIQAAATATMQTMAGQFSQAGDKQKAVTLYGPATTRPALIGTCLSYAPDSVVVKKLWPAHYSGPSRD